MLQMIRHEVFEERAYIKRPKNYSFIQTGSIYFLKNMHM